MKSNQKLSLMFWLFKAKATKKDGKAPLYVRITIDGLDDELSLSCKVLPEHWNSQFKRVSKSEPDSKKINSAIDQARVDLERLFVVLQHEYEDITPLMLKRFYKGLPPIIVEAKPEDAPQEQHTLLKEFDAFIRIFKQKVEQGLRSDGTLSHWGTTKDKVASFIAAKYGLEDIPLCDIKYEFADHFYNYLTLEAKKNVGEATANTHVKKAKQILIACSKSGKIEKNPIAEFICTEEVKDVPPLEWEELITIIKKDIQIPRLAQVRDAFVFQCFTGFAYQDLYGLSPENIIIVGRERKKWLIKERGKTKVGEMVPILPIVSDIIEKYKTNEYCMEYNKLIPVNSNTRYNGYLKELAAICGINRELKTHLARHTFADIALNNGAPLEDVSRMLGHKSMRTTQRYAKVRKPRIAKNMAIVEAELFDEAGRLIM
jgi:site-specific recombinase XerD